MQLLIWEKTKKISPTYAKNTHKSILMNNKYENLSRKFKLKSFKIITGKK